ncbi:hypothetical protein CDAR_6671 [Caerostris darwini]|uniref:Uncharacterized protein n=1 Tax=Caerostris darwini TaxID=1538125 RepID=A0AAV4S668_9ARAC|nr:hypothetical protein CDAR_6671 [Caerostris darwini]
MVRNPIRLEFAKGGNAGKQESSHFLKTTLRDIQKCSKYIVNASEGVLQDSKTVLSANDYSSFQMRMDGLALIAMPPMWIRRFSGASIFSDEICGIECWANNDG